MIKILAVDDIPDNLISIKAIIKDVFPDAAVLTAENGKKAIELADLHDPDLIFLDILMPGMDGFEVCKRLKENQRLSEIPVVFLTALKETRENRMAAINAGGEGFLSKPADIAELTVIVRSMLKIRAANLAKREEKMRLEEQVALRTRALHEELSIRKKTEKELFESQELLNLFFKQSLDGFFFMMLDQPIEWNNQADKHRLIEYVFEHQRITKVNDAMLSQYGAKREEFLNKTPADLFAHDPAYGKKVWYDFFEKGSLHIDTDERKLDGTPMVINGDYILMYDDQKRILGHFGVQREVTRERENERQLRESETKFRHIFEATNVAKSLTELNGYIHVNQAFCNLLGYTSTEMSNKRWQDITVPESIKETENMLVPLQTGKQESSRFEKPYLHKNGSVVWGDVSVAIRKDDDGKPMHYITTVVDISDRKRIEESLRQSETKYRYLFENNPQAMWIYDLETLAILEVNEAAILNYGYSKDEFLSMTLKDIRPDEDVEAFLMDVASTTQFLNKAGTWRHKKKNGQIIFVDIISHLVDFENKAARLVLANDITIKKLAEEALNKASENWNRTFKAMNSGIALLDIEQNIIQSNVAFQEMVGSDSAALMHKSCFHFVHGTSCPIDNCPFTRMSKSKVREMAEVEANGKVFEVIVDPILNEVGEITGAVHIMTDISERKRNELIQHILYEIASSSMQQKSLEELLVITRTELARVLDTTNFFVAVYQPERDSLRKIIFEDIKDDFIEWQVSESLSGYVFTKKETLLMNYGLRESFMKKHNLKLPGTPAKSWLGVPLTVDGNAVGVIVIQSYTNEDAYNESDIRLVELIAHELSVVLQRDKMILDLISAKNKAEESDRLKSAFLANMSHEIRTPMNGILGFMDLLQEPDLDQVQKADFLRIMNQSGQRLLSTINDIIEIAKIEANETPLRTDVVNVMEVMRFHLRFFYKQAADKGVELKIGQQLAEAEAIIETDRYKLESILTNLIKNAIKFTDKGNIEFGNYLRDQMFVFYVKDTGRGIPAHRLDAIFKRFVQADLALTRAHEGSGLGLSIVQAYVQSLGGSVSVESKQGEGSTFTFSIPYLKSNLPEPEKDEPMPTKALDGLTILFAEDDEASYQLLKIMMGQEKITFIHAINGEESILLLKQNPEISMILMDMKMPGMDGFEATRKIRTFNPNIPIIAQTAYALHGDRENAFEAGCTDYISKPLKRKELMRMIEKYSGKVS